jgi:hypothetical protein
MAASGSSLKAPAAPSASPSVDPSASPSAAPSASPSGGPSAVLSASPSGGPSASPCAVPSASPYGGPSASPSAIPSGNPRNPVTTRLKRTTRIPVYVINRATNHSSPKYVTATAFKAHERTTMDDPAAFQFWRGPPSDHSTPRRDLFANETQRLRFTHTKVDWSKAYRRKHYSESDPTRRGLS